MAACNALTGSSAFEPGERCTGPSCGKCQAGQYVDAATGLCVTCPPATQACGSLCCASSHLCVDAASSRCSQCSTSETECGDVCCGAGLVCLVAELGRCAQDCGEAVRCGSRCCAEGQVCNAVTEQCIIDCGETQRCGTACCGEGQRCDAVTSTCVRDCGAIGAKSCGPSCCAGVQTCLDEATGKCGCDPAKGAAGDIVCGSTCCGLLTPHCVAVAGTERCSACEEAALECGLFCCPKGQSCLDGATGACGTPFGKPHQSCEGGLVCPVPDGKGGTEMADCCQSITVPEATFVVGLDGQFAKGGARHDGKSYKATVSAYSLDRFEVTVGRFRRFVDAYDDLVASGLVPEGAGANRSVSAPAPGSGWRGEWHASLPRSKAELRAAISSETGCLYRQAPGPDDTRPINCVDWYIAFAFCAWDGGRLPTEAEWEAAASNGVAESTFPWGEFKPSELLAVYCKDISCTSGPSAVGSRPAGANLLGHRDLAGNVWEWVLDGFAPYPTVPTHNHAETQALSERGHRGASHNSNDDYLPSAYRGRSAPIANGDTMGVRCARDL